MMARRLSIDADLCTGHGRCYSISPNLLTDDFDGFVTIRGTSIDIEPDQTIDAEAAVRACPEQAVQLSVES